eukprot:scaffold325440_cov15-Prasinocladus_malaysianus.AAC.1
MSWCRANDQHWARIYIANCDDTMLSDLTTQPKMANIDDVFARGYSLSCQAPDIVNLCDEGNQWHQKYNPKNNGVAKDRKLRSRISCTGEKERERGRESLTNKATSVRSMYSLCSRAWLHRRSAGLKDT